MTSRIGRGCLAVLVGAVVLGTPSPGEAVPRVLEQNVPFNNYWSGWSTDLVNLTGGQTLVIQSVNVQAALAGGPAGAYSIKVFSRPGTSVGFEGSAAGWTLAGEIQADVTAGFPTVLLFEVPLTTPFTIGPGGTAGLYAVVNDGVDSSVRLVGTLGEGDTETNDGTLRINNAPGRWVDGYFGGVIFPSENVMPQLRVTYDSAVEAIPALGGGGLLVLVLLLAAAGAVLVRRLAS